jgi:hypothetical protein
LLCALVLFPRIVFAFMSGALVSFHTSSTEGGLSEFIGCLGGNGLGHARVSERENVWQRYCTSLGCDELMGWDGMLCYGIV